MRTTIDVDPKLLAEVEEIFGETSPSKAVNAAMREFVRQRKLKELRALLGTMDLNDTLEEDEKRELEDMERNAR